MSWMTLNAIWARHNKGRVAHPTKNYLLLHKPWKSTLIPLWRNERKIIVPTVRMNFEFFSALVCRKFAPCSYYVTAIQSLTFLKLTVTVFHRLPSRLYLNINAVIFIILIFLRESRGKSDRLFIACFPFIKTEQESVRWDILRNQSWFCYFDLTYQLQYLV